MLFRLIFELKNDAVIVGAESMIWMWNTVVLRKHC